MQIEEKDPIPLPNHLETTQKQIHGFFRQLPFKCYLPGGLLWEVDLRFGPDLPRVGVPCSLLSDWPLGASQLHDALARGPHMPQSYRACQMW